MKDVCICGKRIFGSMPAAQAEASDYIKQFHKADDEVRAYECKDMPGNFHIGHKFVDPQTLFSVPKGNLIRLVMPTATYYMVSISKIPLDANIINGLLNNDSAIICAKQVKFESVKSPSAEVQAAIKSVKCKALHLDAWAAINIKKEHSRLAWISKTHHYLASQYEKQTAESINSFVGVQPEVSTPAFSEANFQYYMTSFCFKSAMDKGSHKYVYHTNPECWALHRSKSQTTGFAEIAFQLREKRLKLCTVCAGTARKRVARYEPSYMPPPAFTAPAEPERSCPDMSALARALAAPPPPPPAGYSPSCSSVVPPVSSPSTDPEEISIGGIAYVRKDSIKQEIVEKEVEISVPQTLVLAKTARVSSLQRLVEWLKENNVGKDSIVTFYNFK